LTERMKGRYEPAEIVDKEKGVLRRCTHCGEFKGLYDCFYKNGLDENGQTKYRDECKLCYNIKRAANRKRSKKAHSDFVGGMKRRGEEEVQFTHQDWKEVLIFFGGECAYCGRTPRKGQKLTKDHLVPVSTGGKTCIDNIVPACSSCNSSKGNEDFKVWFMKQSFFSQDRLNRIFKWRSIMRQV
jgi:5-methylcytosine-specific restriction endonuclease McrA